MGDSWFFQKWPNWLRWILALPIAVIGMFVAHIIGYLSQILTFGFDSVNGILYQIISMFVGVGGFVAALFLCVPRHKGVIAGCACILFTLFFTVIITLNAVNGYLLIWDNLINLITMIGCIIYSIKLFRGEYEE